MVAAGRGYVNVAEQLLSFGANLNVRASNDWTALDWARNMKQSETVDLIEAYM
jgi:FOG: Ankyrin repeat